MKGLNEFLETKDFKRIVVKVGNKFFGPLRFDADDFLHEVRISMFLNLRNKEINACWTTITYNHVRYTALRLLKEKTKKQHIPKKISREFIGNSFQSEVDNRDFMVEALNTRGLTTREKTMLKLKLEGKTLDEVGLQFSCSKERVRQITNDAITKIKRSKDYNENNSTTNI